MASAALVALVQAQAPKRPYCAFVKNNAVVRQREIALTAPYLQLNPPAHRSWIILDIDRSGASHAWEDAGLPVPTYCAINRQNRHAHIGYALSAPVCTSDAARLARTIWPIPKKSGWRACSHQLLPSKAPPISSVSLERLIGRMLSSGPKRKHTGRQPDRAPTR